MSRVFLVGAGASRGTLGENAPVSEEFGQYLNKIEPCWNQKYPYLACAISFLEQRIKDTSKGKWALDKVWGAIDTRVKLQFIWGLNLPGTPFLPPNEKKIYKTNLDPWGFAGFELRCVLARVYGNDLNIQIQKAVEGSCTLKMELVKLEPGDCVISFNYDLLVEKILEKLEKKINIAHPYLGPGNASYSILLSKPHGSLNWVYWSPENEISIQILNEPMREDDIDFSFEQKATRQPGIAAPVPFKSEIISPELQVRKVPSFFYLLIAQWRWAIECLSKAEKLVILGYGFPREDIYLRYLFAEAAAKRKPDKKLEIEVYETEQHYQEVKGEIEKIFKSVSRIQYKGKVESVEQHN